MKNLALICAIASLSYTPAHALDRELEALNQNVFQSVDRNNDGMLSRREVDLFRQDVMISQDYDADGIVTAQEHMSWDMGWQQLAEE